MEYNYADISDCGSLIMRLNRASLLAATAAIILCLAAPGNVSFAQNASDVSVVTLQVVPQQNGTDNVVTPAGRVVPLPGAGVNSQTVQIYIGAQGGCWYVDRTGQTVDLTMAMQKYRAMTGGQSVQAPQYAPVPQQSSSNSGSGLGTAAAAAGAAGLGAMAGAAMANQNYYNNVPYGTPVYYPRGANPYYVGGGGGQVNVVHNTDVNANYYDQHANTFQQQNQWYSAQRQQNSAQFKNWQGNGADNPFVRQSDGRRFGQTDGTATAGGGRFGQRDGDNGSGSGGRFGQRQQDGDGGRFGQRGGDNQDGGGGGRFGRRQQEAGGDSGGRGNRQDDGGGLQQRQGDRQGGERQGRQGRQGRSGGGGGRFR